MMKKSLLLLLTFALLLSLAACGGTGDESTPSSAPSDASEASAPDATEPVNLKTLLETVQQTCTLDSGSIYSSYSDTLGEYMDEEMILGKYGAQSPAPDFSVSISALKPIRMRWRFLKSGTRRISNRQSAFCSSESTNCWRAPSIIPSWILRGLKTLSLKAAGIMYIALPAGTSRRYAPLLRKRSAEI